MKLIQCQHSFMQGLFSKVYFKRSNIEYDILRLVDILNKAISINPQSSVLYAFRAFVKIHILGFLLMRLNGVLEPSEIKNKLDVKKAILMEPENLDTFYWSSKVLC